MPAFAPQAALRLFNRRALRNNETALVALAALLGCVIGLGVVAIDRLVQGLHRLTFGLTGEYRLSEGIGLVPWKILVMPALGGLLVALSLLAIRRWRPADIIDPVEANALYGGRMSFTDSMILAYLAILSAGFGASVGLEAALTQLGGGFCSRLGQFLRLRRADLRLLVGCGAAAAISAAFNAPLAGAFYAFELIIGNYVPAALAMVAAASLAGAVTARSLVGGEAIFALTPTELHVHLSHYPIFILIGVAAAMLGILTMRLATWTERLTKAYVSPPWLRTALGGLGVGVIGLGLPQVLGSGHGAVQQILRVDYPLELVLALLIGKTIASALSVGAGFRGGLFSSSLFLGGLLGAVAAGLLQLFFPQFQIDRVVLLLVGMGSTAAAIVGAPLTMIFLILELTGDFPMAVAVTAGVIIASTVVRQRFGYSFSTWRFHVRGVPISGGHDVGWVRDLSVNKVMSLAVRTAPDGMKLRQLRQQFPLGDTEFILVLDADGRYAGLIQTIQIHFSDFDGQEDWLLAKDFAAGAQTFLLSGQSVQSALGKFVDAETEALPVLSDPDQRKVMGLLTEGYALRRYRQELERVRNEELGQSQLYSPV